MGYFVSFYEDYGEYFYLLTAIFFGVCWHSLNTFLWNSFNICFNNIVLKAVYKIIKWTFYICKIIFEYLFKVLIIIFELIYSFIIILYNIAKTSEPKHKPVKYCLESAKEENIQKDEAVEFLLNQYKSLYSII